MNGQVDEKIMNRLSEFGNNIVASTQNGEVEVIDAGDVEVVKIGKDIIVSMPKDKDVFMVKGSPFRGEADQVKKLNEVV
jgi:hypothetical protein